MPVPINVARVVQQLLTIGVQIAVTEFTKPKMPPRIPPPEAPEAPAAAPPKPLSISLYKDTLNKVRDSGGTLPAGMWATSASGKFIPEHAEKNRQIVNQALANPEYSTRNGSPIATSSATVKRLKERLAEELYRMQLDLEDGAHIGGIPCDCLDGKHKLGLRATAKELLSMDTSPVSQNVLGWLAQHEAELNPQAIKQYGPDHYKKLATDMRDFRKELGA